MLEALDVIGKFISTVGFPIALVGLGCLAVWRIGKPAVEKLISKHIEHIDKLSEAMDKLVSTSVNTEEQLKEIKEILRGKNQI